MIAYHGTRSGCVELIARTGIVSREPDDPYVYLSTEPDCAWHFAFWAADERGEDPVLIEVDLPVDALTRPLSMGPFGGALEHLGPVPPDQIVGVIR